MFQKVTDTAPWATGARLGLLVWLLSQSKGPQRGGRVNAANWHAIA